jgi:hypothetical protein
MDSGTQRITLLVLAAGLVGSCTEGDSGGNSFTPPPLTQKLAFEYRVVKATPEVINELVSRVEAGEISLEEVARRMSEAPICKYQADFDIRSKMRDVDAGLEEHTLAPDLRAFGNPGSAGFNFYINAYQARNSTANCPTMAHAVQGLELVSLPGHASEEWRPGESATLVMRPELGSSHLGQPVEAPNRFQGQALPLELAIDNYSADGYFLSGRFRFLATSDGGEALIIVTGGSFTMNNDRRRE